MSEFGDREKKTDLSVLYKLWMYLYVSQRSLSQRLLWRETRFSGGMLASLRHLFWVFSRALMSSWYMGFHTGEAYSSKGLIRDM